MAGTAELLERTSRTFALAIQLLPEPSRTDVTLAYLVFRVADTLEDSAAAPPAARAEALTNLAALLRNPDPSVARSQAAQWAAIIPTSQSDSSEDAWCHRLLVEFPAVFAELMALPSRGHEIIRRHAARTAEGMAQFVRMEQRDPWQLTTLAQLKEYCYIVAGIVGEMLCELFVLRWPALGPARERLLADAATFGEGLQLVNILKDQAADAGRGRSYLPAGVDRREVFQLAADDLRVAERYVETLRASGAPTGVVAFARLPMLLARATLDEVERSGAGAKISRQRVAEILEVALASN